MANMTFKANLLPNTDLGYSLGSDDKRWKINNHTINASVDAGIKDRITYYSDDDIISPSINMKNIVDVSTSVNTKQHGLRLWGITYGNTASTLLSNTAGVLSYGDGGPQIQFSTVETGGQQGALIYTDHDSAGTGVSWHFVSDQPDWNVNSKRFVAKSSVTIGANTPNTSYALHITGKTYGTDILTINENIKITKKNAGYWLTDSSNTNYPAIYDNGTNLWIGSNMGGSGTHHTGATFLSTGYNSDGTTGYPTAYLAIPSKSGTSVTFTQHSLAHVVTVGTATKPVYADSNGALRPITSYEGNAATATKATQDKNGLQIDTGYLKLTGGTVTGTLILSRTTDASGTADNKPALIVGGASTAAHIEIDNNEILAKSNGTTPTTLYLQDTTGIVNVSGSGGLQVPNGSLDAASHIIVSTKTAGNAYNQSGSAIQIREVNRVGTAQSAWTYAPKIGFHWGSRCALQLGMDSSQYLRLYNNNSDSSYGKMRVGGLFCQNENGVRFCNGTSGRNFLLRNDGSNFWGLICTGSNEANDWITPGGGHPFNISLTTGYTTFLRAYGAVWNDYAEFRITKSPIEPGRCMREIGDDTLELTTDRLQAGCEIVTDTYGFAIGESETAKTPTAASGRVLAFPYEDREEFRKHIGEPVCSGPNGTVSIMTHEEEKEWPSKIIGTVSAVPDYEEWGTGKVKVNGRVWIRIR